MKAIFQIQRQASSRNGKRRLHHIEIKPTKNGGHMVEHHYAQDGSLMYHEPDVYAFRNGKDALGHLAAHLEPKSLEPGEQQDEEEA